MQIIKNDGFEVLRVKFNEKSNVIRHLYLKRFVQQSNDQKCDDNCENRTLFMLNLPPWITENHIRYLFRNCGKIIKIFFAQKPSFKLATMMYEKLKHLDSEPKAHQKSTNDDNFFKSNHKQIHGYKICHVVFAKLTGLSKVFEMIGSNEIFTLTDRNSKDSNVSVIRSWQSAYNDSILQQFNRLKMAEDLLANFNEESNENEQQIEQSNDENKQDQNGWIVVNRQQRRDSRRALIANRQHDQKIQAKYDDRQQKRRLDEARFDEQIAPLIDAALKKKKKNPRKSYDSF